MQTTSIYEHQRNHKNRIKRTGHKISRLQFHKRGEYGYNRFATESKLFTKIQAALLKHKRKEFLFQFFVRLFY